MFCMKCSAELPDHTKFCHTCGQTMGAVSAGGGAAAAPARIVQGAKPQKSSDSKMRSYVVGMILLAVLGISWFEQRKTSNPLPSPVQAAQSQPQLHTQTTGDQAFTVTAGGTERL
jgi:hypothetical protein